MKQSSIFADLNWTSVSLPATATGVVPLKIAQAGTGKPRATLIAGVHGDEGPWGALAIHQLLQQERNRLSGSLQVVFAANPIATMADRRNAPLDELDLNRVFPGHQEGSHTERIAAALMPFISDTDVLVDLHGGGSWCVNAFTFSFPGSEDLAALVDVPFITKLETRPGQLSHYAREAGAKIIAIEMGGKSRDELAWCKRLSQSLERILVASGVFISEGNGAFEHRARAVDGLKVLRPSVGGVFVPVVREDRVGTCVDKATLLGKILDLSTMEVRETFEAPYESTALLLLRPHITAIEGGAMTYVIAKPVT
ncbi:MAG: M14 family metallopeptidase [Deinococcota bacterium]|nr:M14 family metallopeptidase [Deinococcota bacterium]